MDTQDKRPSIDPLRRVFLPREGRMSNGDTMLRTVSNDVYIRDAETGVVRSAQRKMNGKQSKRLRARVRRQRANH